MNSPFLPPLSFLTILFVMDFYVNDAHISQTIQINYCSLVRNLSVFIITTNSVSLFGEQGYLLTRMIVPLNLGFPTIQNIHSCTITTFLITLSIQHGKIFLVYLLQLTDLHIYLTTDQKKMKKMVQLTPVTV